MPKVALHHEQATAAVLAVACLIYPGDGPVPAGLAAQKTGDEEEARSLGIVRGLALPGGLRDTPDLCLWSLDGLLLGCRHGILESEDGLSFNSPGAIQTVIKYM